MRSNSSWLIEEGKEFADIFPAMHSSEIRPDFLSESKINLVTNL